MRSWEVRLTWLDCNQRSYVWIFVWILREDVRLACTQTRELFFDLHVPFQLSGKEQKIIYANVYRNTINDGDSQTSPLPIFTEGGGTSVHRLVSYLMHDIHTNSAPSKMVNLFSQTSSIHAYNTRSSSKTNMYIKKFNLKKLRQAVPIFGAKLWNEIPGRMIDASKKCLNKN